MKNILKYKWFQLSTRQRLSPFPNIHSMESICSKMKEVVGIAYRFILILFEDRLFWAFFEQNDYNRVGRFTFNKLKKKPDLLKKLIQKVKGCAQPFLKWLQNLSRKDLTKISNRGIVNFHHHYISEYKKIYSHYFVILTLEKFLIEYLKDLLQKNLEDNEGKIGNYLNVMITEPTAMVAKQEEIAALKIAVKIFKNKKWLTLFKLRGQKIEEEIKRNQLLYNLIKNHEKEFFWLTRDYEDPVLTFQDIIERIKKHLTGNPENQLNKHRDELRDLERKRKAIIKELKLTQKEQAMFKAMRDGMYLKEFRKRIVSESLYWYDFILKEIARRGGLTLKQVRFLLEDEMAGVLAGKKNWNKILNERLRRSGYSVYYGKTKVITGKDVDKLFKHLVEISHNVKDIHGFAAAPGKAIGPVKIVMNPDECNKVKKGDILVSAQVVPSFSPWISISAGLICDGGTGITSHPATLAREAKIPCVTGTKIATRILKDGDKVEVDGYQGMVRKIK